VEEFESGFAPMQGVGTSTAGFVGLAEKGPVSGAPILVTNYADFKRKFGDYLQESKFGKWRFLAYAVNSFFANGGTRAFIMRVAPKDAKAAKVVGGPIAITAKNPGAWGNAVSIVFTPASKAKTQILEDLSETLGAGMYRVKTSSGFAAGDVVAFSDGKTVAYGKVASVDGNVVGFEAPFEGAVVDTNILPTKTIATCEMNVELRFDETVESFEFASFNQGSSNALTKLMGRSELVEVQVGAIEGVKAPFDVVAEAFPAGKESVTVLLREGGDGTVEKIAAGDFIGKDNGPGARTGIQAFLDNTDVAIMAAPGITDPNVQLSLVAQCSSLGDRFAILDMDMDKKSVDELMEHRSMIDSDYAALYHPWLETYDMLDKKSTFIPPSGAVAGIYARTDNLRGVFKAPANEAIQNCTGLYCNYNTSEQDLLNPKGVNLIRRIPGMGIRVWGARTCSSNPLWKYINIRRLFIFVEESIKANTGWVVFEPNDELLWIRVKRTIEVFLEGLWKSGALSGSTTSEAFFVDIGRSTMSQDDIDNGRLICVIGIAPVKPAEFVIFRITQKTGE